MTCKTVINPAYGHVRPLVERILQEPGRVPDGARVIYDERNRLYQVQIGTDTFVVKAFRVPNPVNRLAYTTLRQSKARRSYDNAVRLQGMGVDTPDPVAWMEVRHGLLLSESFYISLLTPFPQIRHWERRPDAPRMLKAFGHEMLRLHRLGVWHKDFSPGNVLVETTPAGEYRFYHIDLNRMKFDDRNPRHLMDMFGRMHGRRECIADLARAYTDAMDEGGADGFQLVAKEEVLPMALDSFDRFWTRHARKERLKARLNVKKT